MAIAKFASDKDYQIFIDMELAGKVTPNSMLKVTLETGDYFIQIKDEEGHLIKEYDMEIKSSDNQLLQKIDGTDDKLDTIIENLKNDSSLVFHCDRASFCHNGLYGFVDKKLNVVIPPIYYSVNEFVDDKAFVVRNFPEGRKTTMIDSGGNMFFNRWFNYIGESDDTILLGIDNRIIVYSKTKCDKVVEYYNAGYDYKHPIIPVFKIDGVDEFYGFIDFNGNEVVPLLFDKVWNFEDTGLAKASYWGICGFINNKNFSFRECVTNCEFTLSTPKDLLFCGIDMFAEMNKIYVSEHVCKTVIPNIFNEKWILTIKTINNKANEPIVSEDHIICDKILFIGDGCYAYRIGNNCNVEYLRNKEKLIFNNCYIFPANGCVIGHGFDDYFPDTFITRKNGKYGLISKNGEVIFPYIYDYIVPIQPEYFIDIYTKLPVLGIIQEQNKFSIANLSENKVLLPFTFDSIERIKRGMDFRDTIFVLRHANQYQLFSANNNRLSDEYDEIIVCDNNYIIRRESNYGIIDDYGIEIVPLDKHVITQLNNVTTLERKFFKIGNGNTYALGEIKSGKIITEQIYNNIFVLCSGTWVFVVEIDNKYGCINEKGEVLVPAIYSKIEADTDYWAPWKDEYIVSVFEKDNVSFINLHSKLPHHLAT